MRNRQVIEIRGDIEVKEMSTGAWDEPMDIPTISGNTWSVEEQKVNREEHILHEKITELLNGYTGRVKVTIELQPKSLWLDYTEVVR